MKQLLKLSNSLNTNPFIITNQLIYNNYYTLGISPSEENIKLINNILDIDPQLNSLFSNSSYIKYTFDKIEDDLTPLHISVLKEDIEFMLYLLSINIELIKIRTFSENTPFLMFVLENGTESYMSSLIEYLKKTSPELLSELILEVNLFNENIFDFLKNNETEYYFLDLKKELLIYLK
mgnify:CR=1 FL=1|jgi:ankyrin repeat protein